MDDGAYMYMYAYTWNECADLCCCGNLVTW